MLFDLDKRKKKRKLTNLEINEVSIVDKPANNIPFAIIKNKDSVEKIEKADSVKIEIDTDFTIENTILKVNGNEIPADEIDNFYISFYKQKRDTIDNTLYPKYPFYFSYTKIVDDENGARILESYQVEKNKEDKESVIMVDELKEATLKLFGKVVPDIAVGLDEDKQRELAKSLNVIDEYSTDFPSDLRIAIGESILIKASSVATKVSEILREAADKIAAIKDNEEETEENKIEEKEEETEETDESEEEVEEETEEEEKPEEDEEETETDEESEEVDEDKEVDLGDDEIELLVDGASEDLMDEILGG